MVSVVSAIITAPRKVLTIDRSLETWFRQPGLPVPYVFCEPGSELFYYKSQVKIRVNEKRLGCFDNWWFSVRWLLHNTESDYILICEDDIAWCVDGWKYMDDFKSKDKVLSGWTPAVNATRNAVGWQTAKRLSMFGLCGSLCLLFPRKAIAEVLYNRHLTKVNRVHLDTDIGFAIQDLKYPIYQYHPSIVTHLGVGVSTFDVTESGNDARRCYANCTTNWPFPF